MRKGLQREEIDELRFVTKRKNGNDVKEEEEVPY